jgi:hypothetical protein
VLGALKGPEDNQRGPWGFVFVGAFIGALMGNALTGGTIGLAVMVGYVIAEHQTIQRRKRAAEREHTHADDEADEDDDEQDEAA